MLVFAPLFFAASISLGHAQESRDLSAVQHALAGQVATVLIPPQSKAPNLAGVGALMHNNVPVAISAARNGWADDILQLTSALKKREKDLESVLQGHLDEADAVQRMRESSAPIGLLKAGTRIRVDEFNVNGLLTTVVTALSGSWGVEENGDNTRTLLINSCYLHFDNAEAQLIYLKYVLRLRGCSR
jgi:hypothetical protein